MGEETIGLCPLLAFIVASERPEWRTQGNDRRQRQDRADDRDHDDIEIAFAMRGSAHSEQRHHRVAVRQACRE